MYTHGLLTIVSTSTPYGGFAHAVGLRAMTSRHGLGYRKVVIVVDDFVDPFDLRRVRWAISTTVDPGRDVVRLPSMSVTPADPGSSPQGITDADAWFRRLSLLLNGAN